MRSPTAESQPIVELRRTLRGSVTLPGDKKYDELRKPWLQVVDQNPALIVEAESVQDVVAALAFARTQALVLGVISTGHGIALPCDGGLLLRLSKMKDVSVDADSRVATVAPGVLSDELLKATQQFGLVYPAGQVSNVGVVGFTLGGGIGWLVRMLGAAADSVLGAEVVLADGSVVRADPRTNPDLFWALRGGGGNFGVITSLDIALAPVPKVVGGELYFPIERAAELLRFYRAWSSTLSNETSTIFRMLAISPDKSAPPEIRGKTCCMFGLCHADPDTADAVVEPLDRLGPALRRDIKSRTVSDMAALDPASHAPGAPAYGQAEYLKALSDEVIDKLAHLGATMIPPLMQFEVQHLGGALVRAASERDAAFEPSTADYLLHLESAAVQTPMSQIAKATHDAFAALGDVYTGEKYYNFMRGDERPLVSRAFGNKYERLQRIKQRFDPTNIFRLNINVKPDA